MTTTAAPNDLVRGLRYRRWLGRQQLVRGVAPSRPRIKYGLAPGCLGVVLVIVAIYVVMLVALAIQMALYVEKHNRTRLILTATPRLRRALRTTSRQKTALQFSRRCGVTVAAAP